MGRGHGDFIKNKMEYLTIIIQAITGIGLLAVAALQYMHNRKLTATDISGLYMIYHSDKGQTKFTSQIINKSFSDVVLKRIINQKNKEILNLPRTYKKVWVLKKGETQNIVLDVEHPESLKNLENAKKLYVTDHTGKRHLLREEDNPVETVLVMP